MTVPLIERALLHWKTSAVGVALSGALIYALNSWDCKLPSGPLGWMTWLASVGPALLGILALDGEKKVTP